MNYKNLPPAEFKKNFETSSDSVLLDVRTAAEIATGKIKGAVEMDFFAADFNQKLLSLDKDKTYYIYCRSGNRSGQACAMMSENGFKNLNNLAGGMIAWEIEMR
jgi:rhodanese-related sulfurtransferase